MIHLNAQLPKLTWKPISQHSPTRVDRVREKKLSWELRVDGLPSHVFRRPLETHDVMMRDWLKWDENCIHLAAFYKWSGLNARTRHGRSQRHKFPSAPYKIGTRLNIGMFLHTFLHVTTMWPKLQKPRTEDPNDIRHICRHPKHLTCSMLNLVEQRCQWSRKVTPQHISTWHVSDQTENFFLASMDSNGQERGFKGWRRKREGSSPSGKMLRIISPFPELSRWWFQIFFKFYSYLGDMVQFDFL